MPQGARVIRIDEVASLPVLHGELQWHPLRHTLDIQAFGMNAYTAAKAGDLVVEEHTEEALGHEEVYVVLAGRATFTLDGEEVEAPKGTIVHVPDPAVKRGATGAKGTTILAIGAKPGEAFTPSGWERSAEALQFWPAEDWDGAVEVLERHLSETPDNGATHYNLACAHARAGRSDVALDHLTRAVELEDRFAEYAVADDDLVSLREDPRFPQTIGRS